MLALAVMGCASVSRAESAAGAEQAQSQPAQAKASEQEQGWLDLLNGKPVKDGLLIAPLGFHTRYAKDIFNTAMIGVTYDSSMFGTFINSFHDRTLFLVRQRTIYENSRFGVDLFYGLMYGYRGQLSTVAVPFRGSVLWRHNLNPVVSLDTWVRLTEHTDVQLVLTPLVFTMGIKYNY